MIIDTDVLIWYFRGNEKAKTTINNAIPFKISTITIMELMQGAKNKAEQRTIRKQLLIWKAAIIHTSEAISIRATQYVSDFALSHSIGAMDALLAGTAVENGGDLLNANTKHFECIPGLTLKKFIP